MKWLQTPQTNSAMRSICVWVICTGKYSCGLFNSKPACPSKCFPK